MLEDAGARVGLADFPPMRTEPLDKCPISVVTLTKNEARHIGRCLASVAWADDRIVVDSGSTDGTQAIAHALGANVIQQTWLGFVPQRQRGVEAARHDWVLFLDADEVVDAELAKAIQDTIAAGPNPDDGFAVNRRDEFFGVLFPNLKNRARRAAFVRMFNRRRSHGNPDHLIHEEVKFPGRSIELPGVLLHWRSFKLAEQLHRYITNADLEATQMAQLGKRASALKLLGWPVLRFLWVYVARGGWRMGEAGLVVALMIAHAEFLRWATLWERQKAKHLADPPEHLVSGAHTAARKAAPATRSASDVAHQS